MQLPYLSLPPGDSTHIGPSELSWLYLLGSHRVCCIQLFGSLGVVGMAHYFNTKQHSLKVMMRLDMNTSHGRWIRDHLISGWGCDKVQ